MNPIIKKQLESCHIAKIPDFDEDTLELVIPQTASQGSVGLQIDHYYQIELADHLLTPPPESSLHINWNKGIIPKQKFMRVYPIQKLGGMVKVEGCGYDKQQERITEDYYPELWLPMDSIIIEKEVKL